MSARANVPAAPVTISDLSCFAATGLTPIAWRRALRELKVPFAKVGRKTLCRADLWAAAIDRAAGLSESPPTSKLTEAEIVQLAAGRGRR